MRDKHRGKEHFYVVLCEVRTDVFLVVNLSDARGKYDETCVLKKGEEDFIKKRSYVFYERCWEISKDDALERLEENYEKGHSGYKGIFKDAVFKRIYEGALDPNSQTPKKFRRILEQNYASAIG